MCRKRAGQRPRCFRKRSTSMQQETRCGKAQLDEQQSCPQRFDGKGHGGLGRRPRTSWTRRDVMTQLRTRCRLLRTAWRRSASARYCARRITGSALGRGRGTDCIRSCANKVIHNKYSTWVRCATSKKPLQRSRQPCAPRKENAAAAAAAAAESRQNWQMLQLNAVVACKVEVGPGRAGAEDAKNKCVGSPRSRTAEEVYARC